MVLLSCWLLHLIASGYGYGMGVIFVELVRAFEQPRTITALVQSIFTAIFAGADMLCINLSPIKIIKATCT